MVTGKRREEGKREANLPSKMAQSSAVSDTTSTSTLDLSTLLLSVFIDMFIGASVKSGTVVFCVLGKLPCMR